MKAIEYQQIADAFRAAKAVFTSDGRGNKAGLCRALACSGADTRTERSALSIISERLEDVSWLDDWIVTKGYATVKEIRANPDRLRATRIAWLDSLIAEFDAKARKERA